jgi:hypothetical protein
VRGAGALAAALATSAILVTAACAQNAPSTPTEPATGTGPLATGVAGRAVPLPPPTPAQSLGASTPPVVWLGGTVQEVTADQMRLVQGDGAIVALQRLAEGATGFYRVVGDAWQKLGAQTDVGAGQAACIETLMDGTNLVAIRVFLGAACGPI